MQVETDKDFPQLRKQFSVWRKRFPMFKHDVTQIEHIIEKHIQDYAIAGVHFRQTKQKRYLEQAQESINAINRVISTVEKLELMSMLSQG
jgi:hypothetical protein